MIDPSDDILLRACYGKQTRSVTGRKFEVRIWAFFRTRQDPGAIRRRSNTYLPDAELRTGGAWKHAAGLETAKT